MQTYRYSSTVVARIPPELAPELRRLPFVNFVEPQEFLVAAQAQDTGWGVRKVGADWVWSNLHFAGRGAAITILDYGIDSLHRRDPALDGPAGEGVFGDCLYVSGVANTCYQDPLKVHGSHVAGIISARDNQVGWIGIAYDPGNFASVRVCGWFGSQFWCPNWAIVAALDWATSLPLARQIVNMSLQGCDYDTEVRAAVQRAAAAGILLVAAAGNTSKSCSGNPTGVLYPARYPEVIAVSGTSPWDTFADSGVVCNDGSRYGAEVELSAPFEASSMTANGQWGSQCGTSMAAPVVTAVAALVWTAHPDWTASQVRQRLAATAVDRGPSGRDEKFGFGRVSAYWALMATPPPPPPATATISGPSEAQPYATCGWSVTITPMDEPLVYEWTVDGQPAGSNSPALTYTAGTGSFTIAVWIHDALGRHTFDDQVVTVSSGALPCNDQ